MRNVTVIDHPLVIEKLTRLRCKDTDFLDFRRLLGEISLLMAYEVARSFETNPLNCPTPLGIGKGVSLKRDVVLAPILRAGLGMMQSILQIMPDARIGFIGLKRNEQTLKQKRNSSKPQKPAAFSGGLTSWTVQKASPASASSLPGRKPSGSCPAGN